MRIMLTLVAAGLLGTAGALAVDLAQPPATAWSTQKAPARQPADQPAPRLDQQGQPSATWIKTHEGLVNQAKKGGVDLYFLGDSITAGWAGKGKAIWDKEFSGWKPGNFGIGGDQTQHLLYRLDHGELEGVSPKVFVLMIGTNNNNGYKPEEIAAGNVAIIKRLQTADPDAKILLLAIFPRGDTPDDPKRKLMTAANQILAEKYGKSSGNVKYLDIGAKFLDDKGGLSKDIMPDLLHPNEKGYQIWADAIKPTLTEWLGRPAAK